MTTTQAPTVTRTELDSGKYRYDVDGEVYHKASSKLYTHASVYRINSPRDFETAGELPVFFHTRADLAAKGHQVGEAHASTGSWSRIGVVEIRSAAR